MPSVGDLFGVRLRRSQNKTAATIARPTTPPTTPPAIAPVLSLEEDEELPVLAEVEEPAVEADIGEEGVLDAVAVTAAEDSGESIH
jgi:hypothetical protein